jgi:uncharacterized membrane-anchored protein YhcB (DUF1043 family)
MPYRAEKMKLPPELDRRRKLSDEQKDEIRHKYNTGAYSLNGLAKEYSVSKKTVLLIVNPESKRKNDQRIKDHWKKYSPGREERNAITREHRSYKHKLYKEGKIH